MVTFEPEYVWFNYYLLLFSFLQPWLLVNFAILQHLVHIVYTHDVIWLLNQSKVIF